MINPILKLEFRKNSNNVICAKITKQDINLGDWINSSGTFGLSEQEAIVSKIRWMANPSFLIAPKYASADNFYVELSISSIVEITGAIINLCYATDFVARAVVEYNRICIAIGTNVIDQFWNVPVSPALLSTILDLAPSGELKLNPYMKKPITKPPNGKPSGKKTYRCDNCGADYPKKSDLSVVKISTGKDMSLCSLRGCASTIKCGTCKFDEPKWNIRKCVSISDETGKNVISFDCRKCYSKYRACDRCGYCYDFQEYGKCPCMIESNFKPYIKAFNEDVLNYCPKDSYCQELFGIEIEVGTPNKNRRQFMDIAAATEAMVNQNAILKYDSSIDWINKQDQVDNDYKGFEVVTRPMVYKNAVRFLKDFCKGRHPTLRSWEVGTCGLHIHVSKACLSPFEIGKVLLFVNNKGNRGFIKTIAKREDKKYAKFLTKKIMDYKNNGPECHYEAINTSKPHTIEFRIFRGTLNIRTVMSYLQFVKSLIDFVKVTEKDNLTHTHYLDYLFATEKSRFRELKEVIKSDNPKNNKNEDEI